MKEDPITMEFTPARIISNMKYETSDNFLRESSLSRDTGLPVYDPRMVLSLVPKALSCAKNNVEKLCIREQELLAALNVGDIELAKRVYTLLAKTFPPDKYKKSKLYQGLILESENKLTEAELIYTSLNENNDYYPQYRKRLIALHLAKGDREASIKHLLEYLQFSSNDSEAWSQLAKLYFYESMFHSALYCYEELSLLNPQSHVLAARCGDVVYTLGRFDISLKYYCKCLFYYPDYIHALYGILLSSKKLLSLHGQASPSIDSPPAYSKDPVYYDKEKTENLFKIAYDRIKIIYSYQGGCPSKETADAALQWLDSI